jgi:predicted dehydrogenase
MNIVIVGKGRWGQNYINTFTNIFPSVVLTVATRENWKQLIDKKPDGVVVATPPQSHIEIASYALEKDIPTMLEKPVALSLKEAEILKQYTAPILINYVYLFSTQFQNMKKEIVIDNIKDIFSNGYGNTIEQSYSELWDYGPHDIAMILHILQKIPHRVKCTKVSDRSYNINMSFDNFNTTSLIGYSGGGRVRYMSVFDGTKHEYSDVRMTAEKSPLANAIQVFINAINGKDDPRLGLDLSLKVMKILEDCETSLKEQV